MPAEGLRQNYTFEPLWQFSPLSPTFLYAGREPQQTASVGLEYHDSSKLDKNKHSRIQGRWALGATLSGWFFLFQAKKAKLSTFLYAGFEPPKARYVGLQYHAPPLHRPALNSRIISAGYLATMPNYRCCMTPPLSCPKSTAQLWRLGASTLGALPGRNKKFASDKSKILVEPWALEQFLGSHLPSSNK